MFSTPRRWLFGVGILAIAAVLSVLAPPHASAETCYTVQVGSDGATICPW